MSSEALKHLYPISVSDLFTRTISSQLNFQAARSIIDAHPPSTGGGLKVLDWGCGNLLWALGLFPGGAITGVEISEDNLRYARLNLNLYNPNQNFVDILYRKDIKIPEKSFDYSLCFGKIELIDDNNLHVFLQQYTIHSSLRGKLVVTCHN